ncbi:PIG-L deacetylase family protein [Nocardioides acrostichi]|uniref:PIG-L family deacetylase n=1 Tax=Nocardioides acrostichi TaxID=2784339 RepID=A0A930Y9X9_9ACTN|nr:PIG-L deacetylase family protein [Nocardioides acrostichi]MBF4160838.1 PIG-L family deacetylase [Nocardioides acrostichi]
MSRRVAPASLLPGSPGTVVAVHAHPDDEALWTGGTLAGLAAAGHRVVLVMATDGALGLADDGLRADLGRRRLAELQRSATVLGVDRVHRLGYADSGSGTPCDGGFATEPTDQVGARLAALLAREDADVVLSYDAAGGYGHPDHVAVHRAVRAALSLLDSPPRLLEATVDRSLVLPVSRVLRSAGRLLSVPEMPDLSHCFTPRGQITARVDVRPHLGAKIAAIEAHASQATGGPRTASLLTSLPCPLRSLVLGTEWFHEPVLTRHEVSADPSRSFS